MLKGVVDLFKFINECFQWENPLISFLTFMVSEEDYFIDDLIEMTRRRWLLFGILNCIWCLVHFC